MRIAQNQAGRWVEAVGSRRMLPWRWWSGARQRSRPYSRSRLLLGSGRVRKSLCDYLSRTARLKGMTMRRFATGTVIATVARKGTRQRRRRDCLDLRT